MNKREFLNLIGSAAVAGTAGAVAVSVLSKSEIQGEKLEKTSFERIMDTGKIRCGFAVWNPVTYVDLVSGKPKGFTVDLMEKIGERLSLEVEWVEEASWGTITEGVSSKRYDVAGAGLWRNGSRAKTVDFTQPYFYSSSYVIVRKGEERLAKNDDLNNSDFVIVAQEGEAATAIARSRFPKARFSFLPQNSDLGQFYQNVAQRKADALVLDASSFKDFDGVNPGVLKILDPQNPVAVSPVTFGLPQEDMRFKVMIDSAMSELIDSGEIDTLMKKSGIADGSFLPVARPYQPEAAQ